MDNAIFIIVQHSGRHLVSPSCYWLILLLGDVQRNPVPASFPCTVCRKAVKSKQNGVECTRCERWTHASCGGITLSEYKLLSDNEDRGTLVLPKLCRGTAICRLKPKQYR